MTEQTQTGISANEENVAAPTPEPQPETSRKSRRAAIADAGVPNAADEQPLTEEDEDEEETGAFVSFCRAVVRKPWFWLLVAFALPIAIMLPVYIALGTYPFGKYSALCLDMNAQYVFYFEKLRDAVLNGDGILYAWERALGGEFLGIFFYYISSPFTLLIFLLPKSKMLFAVWAIILCKFGTCSATMYYYLSKSRPGKHWQMLTFSVLYALCGYGVVQNTNTMWIDAMYLAPLLLLGLERLIRYRKYVLYTVVLTLIFLCNYYIGYMVAIFTAVYFFYYYFSEIEFRLSARFWKTLGIVALFSLIAVLIACIAFVPAAYSLTFGKSTFQDTDYSLVQRFDFLDFFTKLLPGSYDTVRPEGLPMVYTGVLSLLFLPLYFFSTKTSGKKKIFGGLVLAFFIICMNASTLDLAWHGFSMPNWLNYRYSFLFCLMMLIFAYDAVRQMEQFPYRHVAAAGVGIIGIVCIVQKLGYDEQLANLYSIWFTILLVIAYLALLYPVWKGRRAAAWLLVLCMVGEVGYSAYATTLQLRGDIGFGNYSKYVSMLRCARECTDQMEKADSALYRSETNTHYSVNMPLGIGAKGVSHSTSTLNASVIKLLQQLGYSSTSHHSQYQGGNPVSDSLLGIRYIIYDRSAAGEKGADQALYDLLYRQTYSTDDNYTTYQNPYELGIIYTVDGAIQQLNLDQYTNAFDRLNAIVTAMLGEEETVKLFRPVDTENYTSYYDNLEISYRAGHICYFPVDEELSGKLTYEFDLPQGGPVYAQYVTDYASNCSLSINDEDWGSILESGRQILSLGIREAGEHIKFEISTTDESKRIVFKETDKYFFVLDTELLQQIMPLLQAGVADITDWDSTHITASFNNGGDGQLLFTSIPYDTGWQVKIDGQAVQTVKTLDALIAVDLSDVAQGTHEITFSYFPKIYFVGIAASLLGLTLFILILLLDRRRKKAGGCRKHWKTSSQNGADTPAQISAAQDGGEKEDDI